MAVRLGGGAVQVKKPGLSCKSRSWVPKRHQQSTPRLHCVLASTSPHGALRVAADSGDRSTQQVSDLSGLQTIKVTFPDTVPRRKKQGLTRVRSTAWKRITATGSALESQVWGSAATELRARKS